MFISQYQNRMSHQFRCLGNWMSALFFVQNYQKMRQMFIGYILYILRCWKRVPFRKFRTSFHFFLNSRYIGMWFYSPFFIFIFQNYIEESAQTSRGAIQIQTKNYIFKRLDYFYIFTVLPNEHGWFFFFSSISMNSI